MLVFILDRSVNRLIDVRWNGWDARRTFLFRCLNQIVNFLEDEVRVNVFVFGRPQPLWNEDTTGHGTTFILLTVFVIIQGFDDRFDVRDDSVGVIQRTIRIRTEPAGTFVSWPAIIHTAKVRTAFGNFFPNCTTDIIDIKVCLVDDVRVHNDPERIAQTIRKDFSTNSRGRRPVGDLSHGLATWYRIEISIGGCEGIIVRYSSILIQPHQTTVEVRHVL
mmetsp:Transcript_52677/g.127720  ORF Transcript_52677/g.127720 Transcript_52677/m.127720 type:complete len:219 (-) Transcript_52677:1174-1830(-)